MPDACVTRDNVLESVMLRTENTLPRIDLRGPGDSSTFGGSTTSDGLSKVDVACRSH